MDALRPALAGRDDLLLEPIIAMLLKHITDPRFSISACNVASLVLGEFVNIYKRQPHMRFLDMYTDIAGQSPLIDNLLVQLKRKLAAELRFQDLVARTLGALNMILCDCSDSINNIS